MLLLAIQGQWWETLSNTQQVFWAISIIFSVLFLIQFVLSLVGFDGDVDFDADADADGFELDTDFTLFSVRSIIAFFTFFGWTGVLVLKSGGGTWAAVGFASLSGFIAMFIVGYMMYLFSKLTESGTFNAQSTLYNTGEVYLKIPSAKSGYGKIHLKVKGAVKEMEGDTLPTGASVRVVEVLDDNLLLVEPIKELLSGQK